MTARKSSEEPFICPVGRFFSELEKLGGKKSKFFEHMNKSKLEVLRAVKSLIDEKIEDLEKKGSSGSRKKSTKIKVE